MVAGEIQKRTDDGQAELCSDAQPHMFGRRGDDLDSGGRPWEHILPIISTSSNRLTNEVADAIGQGAVETPLGRLFGNELDVRASRSSARHRRIGGVPVAPSPEDQNEDGFRFGYRVGS